MYWIAICIKIWPEPDSTRYQTDCSSGTGIEYLNTCRIAIFFLYEWPLTVTLKARYSLTVLKVPLNPNSVNQYRHIEQEIGSSTPRVVARQTWYHPEGQSHIWRCTEKNRTNTSWEGDPRKKDAMAWSCHENGWSTHSGGSIFYL